MSLFAVLRRRALIIVIVTLLTAGAAAGFAYATRDTYQSTAKLVFSQTIGPEQQARGLLPGTPDADNLAADNAEMVGSREVAEATSRDLGPRGQDLSPDDIQKKVLTATAKDSDVISITAETKGAENAAELATCLLYTSPSPRDRS